MRFRGLEETEAAQGFSGRTDAYSSQRETLGEDRRSIPPP